MARRKSSQDDITKVGLAPLQGLNYQNSNNNQMGPLVSGLMRERAAHLDNAASLPYFVGNGVYNQELNVAAMESPSNPIPYGQSVYDDNTLWGDAQDVAQNYGDIRGERQPWWSKILNGIGKAGVLAVTTAAESAGLLYGIGQGIGNAIGAEDGHGGEAFLNGLWDNPITNALKNINDFSEKVMPNYYTRDEQENPLALRNMFSANTLGDKILKNFGFMIGAFYGGIPASSLIGKIGTQTVKTARAASLAEQAGMSARATEAARTFGKDIEGLNKWLKSNKLTDADKAARAVESMDRIRDVAKTTRTVSQAIGSLGSAINEGAIEAINNSNDWANMQKQQADAKYQQEIADIDAEFGGTEEELSKKVKAAQKYQKRLNEIEKGRIRMGNADLLLNIPILTASNAFELGKLYARGFDATRRQVGGLFSNGLAGSLKNSTLHSTRNSKKAIVSALMKSNAEGMEEYFQRAASDGAGQAVADSIDRFFDSGLGGQAQEDVNDYILGFGKAIAENFLDPQAWDEYLVGFTSSLFGMPVFGKRQTQNAWFGKGAPIGIAGGIVGNYQDYMAEKKHEDKLANTLNDRVKDPKFMALYKNLVKHGNFDKRLSDAIWDEDKQQYKDIELEQLFEDINAASAAGKLEEFKELIGYNGEFSEKELADIIETTSKPVTAVKQRQRDEDLKARYEGMIAAYDDIIKDGGILTDEDKENVNNAKEELKAINQRLDNDRSGRLPYRDKQEGPFINASGQMDVQVDKNGVRGGEMIEILKKNQQHILDTIDKIKQIRNDIDVETDGRLDDTQISLLTMMRTKLWDYDIRSAEMADDLISHLEFVKTDQRNWKESREKNVEKAKKVYNETKEHLAEVKKFGTKKDVEKTEKAEQNAKKQLDESEKSLHDLNNVLKLIDMLTEEKSTTGSERRAYTRGYGEEKNSGLKGFTGQLAATFNFGETRAINSDEASAILMNPGNMLAMVKAIDNNPLFDKSTKTKLVTEVLDLSILANQKVLYNKTLRKMMNDPSLINESAKNAVDRMSKQEIDNKTEELALNIQNAETMTDLDDIMNSATNADKTIARQAFQKAKQKATPERKAMLEDYEKTLNFYRAFQQQLQQSELPDEIKAGIQNSLGEEFENAISDGIGENAYDKFINNLNQVVKDLADDIKGKPISHAVQQILNDLNEASASVSTKSSKRTAKPFSKNLDLGESMEFKGKKKKSVKGKDSKPSDTMVEEKEDKNPDKDRKEIPTKDSIYIKISDELKDALLKESSYKGTVSELSENLQKDIEIYNSEHPDDRIDNDFVFNILDSIVNNRIADEGHDSTDDKGQDTGNEDFESQKSQTMKADLRTNFKSDFVTQFAIELPNGTKLDYRIPYSPSDESVNKELLEKVQKLLQEYKAYQFVDKNYLGYVFREHPDVKIHFIKSTDMSQFGKGTKDSVIFLAIEWTTGENSTEEAVVKHGFNGDKSVNLESQGEIKPVYIEGTPYQIVGVLSMANSKEDTDLSKAFWALQTAINTELSPKISKVDESQRAEKPFVISDKTTTINSIFTGRLEKTNDAEDKGKKVNMHEFMTSQQGKSDRRISTEWQHKMDFRIGVVEGERVVMEDNRGIVEPSKEYMDDNQGAVLIFLPKADGLLYPHRMSGRTVGDFIDDKAVDGAHSGMELINGILNGDIDNAYLAEIINSLAILFNSDKSVGERMKAKEKVSIFFHFGKGNSPIHFINGLEGASITLNGETITFDKEDNRENVIDFFNALANNQVRFAMPSVNRVSISSRDVINSGTFEIGLRSFYNFNANFTIKPIDADGKPVNLTASESNDSPTGTGNIRGELRTYNLGKGNKDYYLQPDGTFTFNGKPVSTKEQTILTMAEIAQGRQKDKGGEAIPFLEYMFDNWEGKGKDDLISFITNEIKGIDSVFVIDTGKDGVWAYNGMATGNKIFKIGSAKWKKLKLEDRIENARQKYTDKVAKEFFKKRKAKEKNTDTTEGQNGSYEWQQYLYDLDTDTQRIIDDAKQQITKSTSHGNRNHTVDFNSLTSDTIEILLTDDEYKEQQRQFARFNANQITSAQLHEEFKKLDNKIRQRVLNEFDKGDYHSLVNSGEIRNAKKAYEEKKKTETNSAFIKQKYSAPPSTSNGKFSGRNVEDLEQDSADLLTSTIANSNNKWVKGTMYQALQAAEQTGVAIEEDWLVDAINSLDDLEKEDKKRKKEEILNKLGTCGIH